MGGFNNPVVGALNLIRRAIRSPNFVSGSTGWSVNQDGSAEFANLIARGTVTVQNGQGVFVYRGTPGPGTLIVALASASGVDPYGNAYTQGVYMSGYVNGDTVNALVLQPKNVAGSNFQPAEIFTETFATGENQTWISSPYDTTKGLNAATILLRGSDATNGGGCTIDLDAFTTTVTGDLVITNGAIYPANPSAAGAEVWHAVGLVNGWTNNSANDEPASYRLLSSPANSLHLVGSIKGGTTAAGSVQIGTLPSAYWPRKFAHFHLTPFGVAPAAGLEGFVNTSGQIFVGATTGATRLDFNAILPLDL